MPILEREFAISEDDQKIEIFEKQQEIMKKISEVGFANYAETLPGLSGAFNLEQHKPQEQLHRCICCMDERTPCGKHLAGSGILLPEADFEKAFVRSRKAPAAGEIV